MARQLAWETKSPFLGASGELWQGPGRVFQVKFPSYRLLAARFQDCYDDTTREGVGYSNGCPGAVTGEIRNF